MIMLRPENGRLGIRSKRAAQGRVFPHSDEKLHPESTFQRLELPTSVVRAMP
jgi:hypothetical protein